jgi:hypothetical protein
MRRIVDIRSGRLFDCWQHASNCLCLSPNLAVDYVFLGLLLFILSNIFLLSISARLDHMHDKYDSLIMVRSSPGDAVASTTLAA